MAADTSFAVAEISALRQFKFERILHEDPTTHSLILLGSLPSSSRSKTVETTSILLPAILRIERTALSTDVLLDGMLEDVQVIEQTDIYTWLFGWLAKEKAKDSSGKGADLKINIICPATDVHIRKYTVQKITMVTETPQLYKSIVEPYINSFPKGRIQWVDDILTGVSEQDKILYRCPEFIILPDMKWDLVTVSSLYLVAITNNLVSPPENQRRRIRSMRDLRRSDIPWLRSIKREAGRIVKEKWGLEDGSLRCYIHYQPSYYHFHVHIVNATYTGLGTSMTVGQAWTMDDVIGLLELDPPPGSDDDSWSSIMERMTFSYGLGEQHGIYQAMRAAQT